MSELLDSLSSDNLVLLCVIMGFIALCLSVAISIEIYSSNKKIKKMSNNEKEKEKVIESKLNIKESSNIKYVEEDEELEKTKAKLELANLREQLKKEEEEKKRLLEINLELARKNSSIEKNEDNNKNEIEETNKKDVSREIDKTVNNSVTEKTVNKINATNFYVENHDSSDLDIDKNTTIDDSYDDDEESAIISYEELKNAKSFGYTDEEMNKYVDEKDAIISIQELEKLYLESQNIDVSSNDTKVDFEMKRVEDLPEIADNNNFQNSPFISPVYGMAKTEQDVVLEQTANLEKLNEEIKKTNEFLKTLKDLQKNLQ